MPRPGAVRIINSWERALAMNLKAIIKQLQDVGVGADFLQSMQLQYRRSSFEKLMSGLGVFAAGMLVGVGVGLLFAPMRGDELRIKARDNIDTFTKRMVERGAAAKGRVTDVMHSEQPAGTPAP